jgi:cytochrome P450/deferrochelatase/peroxidase EfeB
MFKWLRSKFRTIRQFTRSKYRFYADAGLPEQKTLRDRELEFLEANKDHPSFDFSVYLSTPTMLSRLVGSMLRLFSWLARKTGRINFVFLPYKILARSADVKAAFEDNVNFKVPFGPEMKGIAGPVTFGLGLDDNEHKMQRAIMALYMEHDREVAGADSWHDLGVSAGYILDDCGGRIDVMSEYAVPLISKACLDRFGLQCADPVAFAQWNIAVSIQLFASPSGTSELKLQQLAAASRNIRQCIEHSMLSRTPPSKDTLLGFLLHLRTQDTFPDVEDEDVSQLLAVSTPAEYLSDDRIVAIVAGMVSGFVPTTSLGSGNLMTVLAERPEAADALSKAAMAKDRQRVRDIILEAARFAPAGDPGHFRIVDQDFEFERAGGRKHQFRKNDLVLLSTPEAMRDSDARENPRAFVPGHLSVPNYMFGHTHHSCLGMQMAIEVMTELYLQLFSRVDINLGTKQELVQAGPFPWKRELTFKPVTPAIQTMVTIGVPIEHGNKAAIEALLASPAFQAQAALDGEFEQCCRNGRDLPVADLFHGIELIHNASICIAELTCYGRSEPTVLFEFNIDGEPQELFRSLDGSQSMALRQLIDLLGGDTQKPGEFLNEHVARLRQRPWGHIGLGFNGIGDFPVKQIKQEHRLYQLLQSLVQKRVTQSGHTAGHAAHQLITDLRALMQSDMAPSAFKAKLRVRGGPDESSKLDADLVALKDLSHLLVRPARRVPPIADYTDKGFFAALQEFTLQRKTLFWLTSVIWLPMLISLFYSLAKYSTIRGVFFCTLILTAVGVLIVSVYYLFRWYRRRPMPGGLERKYRRGEVSGRSVKAYLSQPVVRKWLKTALVTPFIFTLIFSIIVHLNLRVIGSTLALTGAIVFATVICVAALFALLVFMLRRREASDAVDESLVKPDDVQRLQDHENRPGLIQNQLTAVNTLKKGRYRLALLSFGLLVIKLEVLHWFRSGFVVDIGTIRQAKWFRLKGTDQLIFQANFDGSWESYLEDFSNKAYQGQNAVWSHCEGYPRTRFMSADGAKDGDNFKRWVRSKQIKTQFWYNRFPRLSNAHIRRNAMVRDGLARAGTATEARAWLSYFGSQPDTDSQIEHEEVQSLIFNANRRLEFSACIGLRFEGDVDDAVQVGRRKAFLRSLLTGADAGNPDDRNQVPAIGFGDRIHFGNPVYLAFSHHGLRCLGLQDADQNFGLSSFSPAFVNGMANRSRILGDSGHQHPDHWGWVDAENEHSDGGRVDVVLFPMAATHNDLQESIAALSKLWGNCASEIVQFRTGRSEDNSGDYEPGRLLGFRDGISQPVIKGTYRHAARPSTAHDVMETGEIILGYRDNRGYFPLTPKIEAGHDPECLLPNLPSQAPGLYVPFGGNATAPRDLGRNGTYIALRQIEIDADGFTQQLEQQSADTGLPAVTIGAKMMGRWPSGAPLVRYPDADPFADKKYADVSANELNDFLYGGSEDPQGARCPLGAHIRRANPRDSLGTHSETELTISNRHRILRRGRSYHKVWFNGDESHLQKRSNKPDSDKGGQSAGSGSAKTGSANTGSVNKGEEGLLFVAMNANLERQFEFVQQTWINGKSFHGLDDTADPILGAIDGDQFSMPSNQGTVTLQNLQSYSRVRGGGYYFMPSLSVLRYLAGGK